MVIFSSIFHRVKHMFRVLFLHLGIIHSEEEKAQKKQLEDYNFLRSFGVETEIGYVTLYGLPIINRVENSRIVIGPNVVLNSSSSINTAGINHPVILSTLNENAEIIIGDGVGMSGTSVVAYKRISIGSKTLLGTNTNVWDTDFHPVDPLTRLSHNDLGHSRSEQITIGENVWVGANTTILGGSVIGSNSVIGAMSLVKGVIPESSVSAGVPARVKRFLE